MAPYRVAFVSPFPPARSGISEYGRQLIEAFGRVSDAEILVIADGGVSAAREVALDGRYSVARCVRFNDWSNPARILRILDAEKPDIVWFNLIYSAFGDRRAAAALGLLTPRLARRHGRVSVVTLHHLLEFVSLNATRFESSQRLTRWGARLIERSLFRADAVVLPLKKYAARMRSRFPRARIEALPIGCPYSGWPRAALEGNRLLVLGRYGSYKRLEPVLDVFQRVRARIPGATLTVAGVSHYADPNCYERVAAEYGSLAGVTFTGYVPECRLRDLLLATDVMVLNHASTTGVSAAATLAACAGVPVVAPALDDLLAMEAEMGLPLERFAPGDAVDAARAVCTLLEDRARLNERGAQLYAAAQRGGIDGVARRYDALFRALLANRR